jgi:hypothetical protein
MPSIFDSQDQEAFHQRAIKKLAQEVDQPIAGVKAVYEGEFARLKSDAKITEYLAIFVSRRARETLLGKHA